MKTLAELLAGGSIFEIAQGIKARSDRFEALDKEASKRADKASTQAELDEMKSLDTEMEQLMARHAELKSIEDAKKRNADRVKAFNTPSNSIPFPSGRQADEDKAEARREYMSKYNPAGSLKFINFGDRKRDEQLAFDFFKFICATSPIHSAMQQSSLKYCEEHGIAPIKALNEGSNDAGGALVPPEFVTMIIRLIESFGVFRQNARVVNMTRDAQMRPRRTGGVTAFWVGEGSPITASQQSYDNVQLIAKKLAALVPYSSELSEDSAISIADEIAFEIAYAFALAEDQAGFNGDASPTYGGITGIREKLKGLDGTIANIAGLQVGAGNAYSELLITDFEKVAGKLPQYADSPRAAWYMHRTFYYSVVLPLILAANGAEARELMAGDRRARPLFLGYPVNFTQVMPATEANSQVCALLGDLSMAAMFGDRRAVTMFTDPYSLAANDQIQVRGTERVDLIFHDTGNASATAALRQPGSMVGLITAAA